MRALPSRPLALRALGVASLLAFAPPTFATLQEAAETETVAADEPAADEPAAEKPAEKPPARARVEGELPYSWSSQLEWRSIGPANMGGRITDIAVHPTDPMTYWVGTAAGGLLKTTNAGTTYTHQFTDENTASIGAVTVAPSNPDVVWVGTGENNPRNSVSFGDGVYKSLDGGETWWHMGLEESFQISRILVHPDDENVVYVGALGRLWGPNEQRGLFKSTDGGATWEKILYVDDKTGVIDIRMKPNDPDTLLVATYERERDLYDSNDPAKKWGPGSGIHRTADGGKTWTEVTEGLPTVTKGRIGLDWYAADPNIVYAIVETEKITQEPEWVAYLGVRSEDADVGARLTEITEDSPAAKAGLEKDDILLRIGEQTIVGSDALTQELKNRRAGDTIEVEVVRNREILTLQVELTTRPPREGEPTDELGYPRAGPYSIGLGGQRENIHEEQGEDGKEFGGVYRSEDAGVTWTRINSLNPRPMYYSEIRVDPSDDNYVYVCGTSLYKSKDGGKTFTSDGHGNDVHVDHHALWVSPWDGRHILLGNDGGLYVTHDRMEHWDHHNHVAIGQFYNVAVDTRRDYNVYGGLQDNGSWGGPSIGRTGGPINSDWFRVGGGDGFVCRVDANDPDLVYYESQNGGMGRRNLRTGEGGFVRPRGEEGTSYRFNWNTPFILSAHNSRIHYSAGNYVFRSLDRGNGARRISPEVTITERGTATALAESPLDSDLLYVGTDDGALWVTRDGGVEWIDLFELNAGLEAEAAPDAKPKAQTVAFVRVLATGDDPVSGSWKCRAEGEGIEGEDQGNFSLELTLGDDGKVTGTIASDIGDGEIEAGTWNADTRELRFRFAGETLTLDFTGKVKDDAVEGEISAAGGAFSFDFSGKRTAAKEQEGAAKTEAKAEAKSEPEPKTEEKGEDEPTGATGDEGDEPQEEPEAKPRKFLKDTIDQLLPGRRYVSSITPSRHKAKRVYVTFDGHRSDDDAPHVFVSEDAGETWESLTKKLPASVGPVRDLEEDTENSDLLFLGTEFGAYVSIDRGETWTELGGNLPTVPVHDYAISEKANELVAGTHGRSIWILDITPLREMSEKAIDADAMLYPVNKVVNWRFQPSRGETPREFVGENPPRSAAIFYSLDKKAKEVSLVVKDAAGEVLREFPEAPVEKGLHRIDWDLRRGVTGEDREGNRRFRRGRGVGPGTYTVALTVGGETWTTTIEVTNDPAFPDNPWAEVEELQEGDLDVDEGGAETEEWDD